MGAQAVSPAWRLVYRIGVVIAALVGGMAGALPVATLGLVVPEYVTVPLSLIAGALVAGISAGWAANLLAPDRTRSMLPAIAGISVAAGAVVAVAGLGLSAAGASLVFPNRFSMLLLSMAVIAIGVSFATWHFRRIDGRLTRDLLTTLGLLGALIVVILGTVFTTCSLMGCTP